MFNISALNISTELSVTKRSVLGKIATIFDPLGFLGPFFIKAKILLQEMWTRGYDWEDEIHDEIISRIRSWYGQLRRLGDVQVPRYLHEAKEVVAKRVITYVDASLQAHGTVVYLQYVYNNPTVLSRLVASKCKVAPLKPMTVPRLELAGAVLGLRLAQHLTLVLGLPLQSVTFYSDSMDILRWIQSSRPYVADRIGEIQMATEPSQWQDVPAGENSVDPRPRGAAPDKLLENSLWWHIPKWLLSEDKAGWPKMDGRSRPASSLEVKTSDQKEGNMMLQIF